MHKRTNLVLALFDRELFGQQGKTQRKLDEFLEYKSATNSSVHLVSQCCSINSARKSIELWVQHSFVTRVRNMYVFICRYICISGNMIDMRWCMF